MERQIIGRYALFTGLCALIPLPFIDDYIANRLRGRMMDELLAQHGVEADEALLKVLSASRASLFPGCIFSVLYYPIRKIFRTLLYIFTIKDCLDWATETAHRGELVLQALEAELLPGEAERVRDAMEVACASRSISALNRLALRKYNPPMPDIQTGADPLAAITRSLQEAGGGGLVVREFRRSLWGPDADTPEIPDEGHDGRD